MFKNSNQLVVVHHDFLGCEAQARCNDEAFHGVKGNTIPRSRPITAQIARSNPISAQLDLRDRQSQPRPALHEPHALG